MEKKIDNNIKRDNLFRTNNVDKKKGEEKKKDLISKKNKNKNSSPNNNNKNNDKNNIKNNVLKNNFLFNNKKKHYLYDVDKTLLNKDINCINYTYKNLNEQKQNSPNTINVNINDKDYDENQKIMDIFSIEKKIKNKYIPNKNHMNKYNNNNNNDNHNNQNKSDDNFVHSIIHDTFLNTSLQTTNKNTLTSIKINKGVKKKTFTNKDKKYYNDDSIKTKENKKNKISNNHVINDDNNDVINDDNNDVINDDNNDVINDDNNVYNINIKKNDYVNINTHLQNNNSQIKANHKKEKSFKDCKKELYTNVKDKITLQHKQNKKYIDNSIQSTLNHSEHKSLQKNIHIYNNKHTQTSKAYNIQELHNFSIIHSKQILQTALIQITYKQNVIQMKNKKEEIINKDQINKLNFSILTRRQQNNLHIMNTNKSIHGVLQIFNKINTFAMSNNIINILIKKNVETYNEKKKLKEKEKIIWFNELKTYLLKNTLALLAAEKIVSYIVDELIEESTEKLNSQHNEDISKIKEKIHIHKIALYQKRKMDKGYLTFVFNDGTTTVYIPTKIKYHMNLCALIKKIKNYINEKLEYIKKEHDISTLCIKCGGLEIQSIKELLHSEDKEFVISMDKKIKKKNKKK
ncbi:conserved Plasmodium protein, unknown function [Plasmodium reichenowi]|uniref:Uncharacterized protein n=1 Tax=Plasmodium reichenowi TaxID=5854 RepID=A0A2P9D2M3_PLARE|nr:conserved Plasmodium protein, unknown function [Plasmodium reichenowi]